MSPARPAPRRVPRRAPSRPVRAWLLRWTPAVSAGQEGQLPRPRVAPEGNRLRPAMPVPPAQEARLIRLRVASPAFRLTPAHRPRAFPAPAPSAIAPPAGRVPRYARPPARSARATASRLLPMPRQPPSWSSPARLTWGPSCAEPRALQRYSRLATSARRRRPTSQ